MSNKSTGVTATERMLADFCERSFLKLWSYPNPYKDDGHELCDLLAVFGNDVFVFFDREAVLPDDPEKDPQVLWDRWKRNVIDRQVKTAHGAERYIRSGRPIFLDGKREKPFPFEFDRVNVTVHKIIVAHGAKQACERASPQNVYGSLAITYAETDGGATRPFHIEIDRRSPVHILDSHNMPIVLSELDTVSDFSAYLREKVRAASALDYLSYCGEEDLLGHYLLNYDDSTKRHVIGSTKEKLNGIMIGEGEWHGFSQSGVYRNTKKEDRISYFWDELIQRTCQNSLDGTLGGNSDILRGQSAIYEMVREPRFMRRGLADKMLSAVERFPDTGSFTRQVTLLPSFETNVAYVLLQLRVPEPLRSEPDFREKRLAILEIACGAAKNKFPNLVKVIGIGIEAPKFSGGTNAEDFILMPCEAWSAEQQDHYRELNKDWNFFETPDLKQHKDRVTQFVQPPRASKRATGNKLGRNDPCPCGSGKKYKKCHG
jgi:hypothetical protein